MKRIAILLTGLMLLSACAQKKSPYTPVPQPPQRMAMPGYSLMPLNEPGWVSIRGKQGLMLSRYGDSIDETQVIMSNLMQVPPVQSRKQLRQFFEQTLADDIYSGRYEPLRHDVRNLVHNDANCVRSHLLSIDRYPVNFSSNGKTMRLESYQQLCLHPDDPRVGVLLEYSQHYYPDHGDLEFSDKADEVLDSLRFSSPR